MDIEARKSVLSDGATINATGVGIGVLIQDVTGVCHACRSGDFISLRFYRDDCSLGCLSLPVVAAMALVAELKLLGVEATSDFDMPEVA